MDNNTVLASNSNLFSWYDYGLFATMLMISTLIGVYFGFVKKQSTPNDYLLGGKEMSVVPVAMSLISSFISGITLLAAPADIYLYGINYWLAVPTLSVTATISYFVCLPVFYDLQITSTYEYLEKRFDKNVRIFASIIFTLGMLLYLPIVIYIPALALSQATGVNIHSITPLICGICVFYTTFGGLKAVVWTDALQLMVMVGTSIVILFLGISSVGGLEVLLEKNKAYGRLDIDFHFDPTKRDSFWAATIGAGFNSFSYVACNQGYIQKCIALPKMKAVKSAVIIFVVGTMITMSFCVITGLIMFAQYYDCDPLTNGEINQADQILPYFIMDVGRDSPGISGLFTAGIFSAALSTLSAVINCLSATIYEDFISPFVRKDATEKTISNYLKLLAVTIGVISTGLVFFVQHMGNLLPLSLSVGGITSGSLLGIFICGMLIPSINAKGAFSGGVVSLAAMTWIVFRSQYYQSIQIITYPTLPLMEHGCQNFTQINSTIPAEFQKLTSQEEPFALYKVSFYYYGMMGVTIVVTVGWIVSKFTPTNNRRIEKKLFSPLIRNLIKDEDCPAEYRNLYQADKMMLDVREIS